MEDLKMPESNAFNPDNDPKMVAKMEEEINKLESMEITGDPIEDLNAYIEITGLRISELPEVQSGLENGDETVALSYLATLKEAKDDRDNIPGLPEIYRKSMEVEARIIEEMIKKAEEREREEGDKKEKESQ